MSRKNIIVLAVAFLAVAGFYGYLYKDSFRKPDIQIFLTIRPRVSTLMRRRANPDAAADEPINVNFGLERHYKLTSIKLVPLNEFKTNKYVIPMWELTTASNSVPTQSFHYGSHIRGMQPKVKGANPSPLEVNTPYRLLVEGDGKTGQQDFTITEDEHLAPQ